MDEVRGRWVRLAWPHGWSAPLPRRPAPRNLPGGPATSNPLSPPPPSGRRGLRVPSGTCNARRCAPAADASLGDTIVRAAGCCGGVEGGAGQCRRRQRRRRRRGEGRAARAGLSARQLAGSIFQAHEPPGLWRRACAGARAGHLRMYVTRHPGPFRPLRSRRSVERQRLPARACIFSSRARGAGRPTLPPPHTLAPVAN
eukprot:332622-Chlamydomonas_euryale.AAC.2